MQGGQGGVGVEPSQSYWALCDALLTTMTVNGQVQHPYLRKAWWPEVQSPWGGEPGYGSA